MPVAIYIIAILVAATIGFLIQYHIIKSAVKNGYLEAVGTINMARKRKPQTREDALAEDDGYFKR